MHNSDRQIDGRLVREYQSGNTNALSELVRRWHLRFCRKAFFIVKDADIAKDVAQESWNTILNKLEMLKDPNSFGSWSQRIVHTKAIDVLRAQAKRSRTKIALKRENQIADEPYVENEKLTKELLIMLQELSTEQQQVVKLFYLNEYTLSEIADLLSIKKGTVKSRLFHAREKLKKILKHRNYEN